MATDTTNGMTTQDFKQLEALLSKLKTHIGKRYMIIPEYLQDGVHITTYTDQGALDLEVTHATIEMAANEILRQKA